MMTPQVISLHKFGVVRSLLLGAGVAYALEKEQYMHIPIVVLFPTVYAGYQLYKNKYHDALF
jgi:hypothetical protein